MIEKDDQNSIKNEQNINFAKIGSHKNYEEENKSKTSKIAQSSTDLNLKVNIL